MEEVWKDIKGYKGHYKVSNLGRVMSIKCGKQRVLRQSIGSGYWQVGLMINGVAKTKKVHRFVADAFIYKPIGCTEVNHKNFDRLNNTIENLEWVTRRYNQSHKWTRKNITSKYTGVSRAYNKWIAVIGINNKRIHLGCFHTEEEASQQYQKRLSEHISCGGQ